MSKFWAVLRRFSKMESAGGVLLVVMAFMAIMIANSPLSGHYAALAGNSHVHHFINDGLMALFFFLIGLEIKREFVMGALSSRRRAILPVVAAIGGMAVPALIYFALNRHDPALLAGWAIPAATDIAFALGVLSLFGSRVPVGLKILLLAIAVMDDLGAILIIAFFYTGDVQMAPLGVAGICVAVLMTISRMNWCAKALYIVTGLVLWGALFLSGIHPTLAGVITALFVPLASHENAALRPAQDLEHALFPWVTYLILPLFAFINAGVPLAGMGWGLVAHPVTVGIAAGLVIGKQIGIFGAVWVMVKSGLSPRPDGCGWGHIYGMSLLCGIGFTMSLFIGGLAFGAQTDLQAAVRVGVLGGSLISALAGYGVLRACFSEKS